MEGKTNKGDIDQPVDKENVAKSPRKRFLDAAPIRVRNVLRHIRLVSNLLNRNYKYESKEFKKIVDDISDELRFLKNKFEAQEKKKRKDEWTL